MALQVGMFFDGATRLTAMHNMVQAKARNVTCLLGSLLVVGGPKKLVAGALL